MLIKGLDQDILEVYRLFEEFGAVSGYDSAHELHSVRMDSVEDSIRIAC